MTELDPDVADEAPSAEAITPDDEQHFVTDARDHRNPRQIRDAASAAIFMKDYLRPASTPLPSIR